MMPLASEQAAQLAAAAVDVAGGSDVGRVRRVNEDSWIAAPEIGLYAVADGMGGHGAGDVASQMAIDTLRRQLQLDIPERHDERSGQPSQGAVREHGSSNAVEQTLLRAVTSANRAVRDENRQAGFGEGTGMGTTLVGLYGDLTLGRVLAFNVGDSRLYRYRGGHLAQLTHDHTLYQEWIEAGQNGPAPPRNIILRALGLFDDMDLDILDIDIASGDLLLLCSDGLSGMLNDHSLETCLASHSTHPLDTLNRQLIDKANANGGDDNISLVTVRMN